MLNRVQYGHDPRSDLFAMATGSQRIGVWRVAPRNGDAAPDGGDTPETRGRLPELVISTQRSAMRGLVFVAPSVLLSIHASGVSAAWRVADDEGSLLADAELLWELKLAVEPCVFSVYADYRDARFGLALGSKAGQVVLVRPQGAELPDVCVAAQTHRNDVTALAFGPQGRQLASAGRDREIMVWETDRRGMPDAEPPPEALHLTRQLTGSEAWPLCLAFSQSGTRLISGGMDDGLYLWDITEAAAKPMLATAFEHHGWIVDATWAPDDTAIAAASWDNTVGVYDAQNLELQHRLDCHKDYVSRVLFLPDSAHLLSASYDEHIGVWDWQEARLAHYLHAHSDWVLGVESIDEGRFITVAGDRTARVWGGVKPQTLACLGESAWHGLSNAETGIESFAESEPVQANFVEQDFPGGKHDDSALLGASDLDGSEDSEVELARDESSELHPPGRAALPAGADERVALADVLGKEARLESQEGAELLEFFEHAPEDFGLGAISSQSEVLEASGNETTLDAGSDVADLGDELDANDDDASSQSAASAEFAQGPLAASPEEVEVEADAQKSHATALKSRLKAGLARPRQDGEGAPDCDEASRAAPVYVGSIGQKEDGFSESLGLDSDVFSAFGELLEHVSPVSEAGASESEAFLEENEPSEAAQYSEGESSAGTGSTQDFASDPDLDFGDDFDPDLGKDFGNRTQFGMRSEAQEVAVQGAEERDGAALAGDERVLHSLSDRSGTLTGARPLSRIGIHAENAAVEPEPTVAGDDDDSPLSSPFGLGESTAPREVTLAHEFETPSNVEMPPQMDVADATSRISGADLALLRSAKLGAGGAARLSAGRAGGADLMVPEVEDGAQAPGSRLEGPEVVETDFADLWERRWSRPVPAMAIIKRPLRLDASYRCVAEFETPHSEVRGVALDTKAKLIVSCGVDGASIIWAFDGAQKQRFEVSTGALNSVVLAADATLVLAGGEDGDIHAWVVPQKTLVKSTILRHAVLGGHRAAVSSLALDDDGKMLLSGGLDGSARAWRLADGGLIATLKGHSGPVSGVGFARAGLMTVGRDASIRMWSMAGEQVDLIETAQEILALDAHQDGHIWSLAGGQVRVHDGQETRDLTRHQGEVHALSMRPDGAVVSGGEDGRVHLYRPGESQPFQILALETPIRALAFSGDYLLVGSVDAKLHLFKRG